MDAPTCIDRHCRLAEPRAARRILVAGLVLLALTGSGVAGAAAPTRPFKGTWLSSEAVEDHAPAGCEVFLTTSQVGNATHLGRFTGVGETCGFNLRVVESPPFNLSGGEPPFFVADFTARQTWTAADGDTLSWSTPDGVFVQSLTDGTSSSVGSMDVAGGTGRFDGASGHAEITAVNQDVTFEGSITFDAAP